MPASVVTSTDRLSFALFLALLVHAMLILGISFAPVERDTLAHTLEVTLATTHSDKAPEQADFIAQANQEGSGTLDEAQMLTTDIDAIFHANHIHESSPQEQQASAPRQPDSERRLVTTSADSRQKAHTPTQPETPQIHDLPDGPERTLLERSLEMASLEAKLDSMRQTYARQPRVLRLTAASTMAANEAYYVNSWRRRIEDNGARNYPREAENCLNDCRLRLLVAILPNGTIHEIRVLESSGRHVLDDAAIRIVRQSAPFAPFTEEMRQSTDRLEIIRTWQFKGNRYLSESN